MLGALLCFPRTASGYLALVTFGDSYTDTWRLPSSPPQYWNGRFSNGPVWVEYLAQQLGLAYDPNNNFAVSGSETDELGIQIGNFSGTDAGLDVVCAIWSGSNDFGAHLSLGNSDSAWNTQINKIVTSLSTACELLYQKGARRIVLFNQLDITELPQIRRTYSSSFRSYLEGKINIFNSRLSTEAESLRTAHDDLELILFDVHASFEAFVANYPYYGFTTSLMDVLSDPSLTDKSFAGPGADYVFWDGQHPSTKTHGLIADAVANLLPAPPSTNPRLSIVLLNDGSVQLRLSGASGFTWRTEASSDLSSWWAISTNTLTGGSVQFSDTATRTTPLRFYRAVHLQ